MRSASVSIVALPKLPVKIACGAVGIKVHLVADREGQVGFSPHPGDGLSFETKRAKTWGTNY